MAPPPLPDFLRRGNGGRPGSANAATAAGAADSGYRADTEDAFSSASGVGRSRSTFKGDEEDLSAAERGGPPGKAGGNGAGSNSRKRPRFPELPGFAPPETHAFAPYEIVPSTAVSSEGTHNFLPPLPFLHSATGASLSERTSVMLTPSCFSSLCFRASYLCLGKDR